MNSLDQKLDANTNPLYKLSLAFLVVSSWVSGILFALYIIGFYIAASTVSGLEAWNKVLPQLYSPESPVAMTGMVSHLFFGSVLLILGPIQFSEKIRKSKVDFHRWVGIFYTLSAFVTGFGGIVFLGILGATGGLPMFIGFGIYGLLMMVCSVQTIRFAMLRQFNVHRQWAIRLFALVLGSWIYRMSYGFIHTNLGDWGLGHKFSGPLDYFMNFAFFVIPLLVAQLVIKGKYGSSYSLWKPVGSVIYVLTGLLICQSTYFFLIGPWGKAINTLFST